jgi:hypothetical protein
MIGMIWEGRERSGDREIGTSGDRDIEKSGDRDIG